MRITTNGHRRETIDGYALPAKVREDFDYIDWSAVERGEDSATFVRYRGQWHDLGDVLLAPESLRALGWHGFNSDSFFSGTAYRYVDENGDPTEGSCEYVVIGYVTT